MLVKTQLYLDNETFVSKRATFNVTYTAHFQAHTIP